MLRCARNDDAEPRAAGTRTLQAFIREALPSLAEADLAVTADILATALSEVDERISEVPREALEIEAYADALADMLCAYVEHLSRRDAGVSVRRDPEA